MKHAVIALILFLLCLQVGYRLNERHPLENDEIYSQQQSIQPIPYTAMLAGHIPEGNNSPLFYIMQKFTLGKFALTQRWENEKDICNGPAQSRLRLMPILCMSLGLSLIFWFFARHWGLWMGLAAFALALTSPLVWTYWATARPYALWILLTTVQLLLLINFFRSPPQKRRHVKALGAVHVLLALTTMFGAAQAVIAAILGRGKLWLTAIAPIFIGLWYFYWAPRYPFRVPHDAAALIFDNLSLERIIFLIAAAIAIGALCRWDLRLHSNSAIFLLAFTCILLAAPVVVIAWYKHLNVPGLLGFELSSRYFAFLTPLSSIGVMWIWLTLWERCGQWLWARLCLIEVMAGMLILGTLQVWPLVQRLLA